MRNIQIALTKGRLEKHVIPLFERIGIDCRELKDKGRKLVFRSKNSNISFILVKAVDVVTYVEHGIADMGVVGKDILLEYENDVYEMVDLEVGCCKICVASTLSYHSNGYNKKRIATKYPNITSAYFRKKGEDVEIIKIEGSVEIAPLLGLADAIIDIVETGQTLKENGLLVFEEVCDISARLIVNKASLKMKKDGIFNIINRIESVVAEKK
ncbi:MULTISPECIES: ATP phosphoribosyltransferase [unclassified Bacillus (in: firmicutes)]|uniref:ATP phosphoribosyltransferase n=1 Tax=unclassified Bacillus (in: firmicutes) TaxID=185979 RepID=UPI0008E65D94|nr:MULTISPECIES: ATP phosphoribosyltransferase [unclassified Bacillus (in: firmicutes)]SFI95973.1 ATP phosphoribosyltransferase catalytic subunit [Bacillus sp. 71mf]SFS64293.1 ATP phosphoribosyltransferase catalytic subunit [Bacillus sp. 103mf]